MESKGICPECGSINTVEAEVAGHANYFPIDSEEYNKYVYKDMYCRDCSKFSMIK